MATITEILKHLRLGHKLQLSFPSPQEREAFRVALYKAKAREDKLLTDILDEERLKLKFAFIDEVVAAEGSLEVDTTICDAKFWLEKKPTQEFAVTIIDEPTPDERNYDSTTTTKAPEVPSCVEQNRGDSGQGS